MSLTRLFVALSCLVSLFACTDTSTISGKTLSTDAGSRPTVDARVTGQLIDDDDFKGDAGPPTVADLKACAEQNAECGFVPDGHGMAANCGSCPKGSLCGVVERNQCTQISESELCQPLSKADACADKECAVEGDGCGGTYSCGECEDGEGCGIESAFQCDTYPVSVPEECPAQIASCQQAGAECGLIGNGCGGLIDCDQELGGCSGKEFCGGGGPQLCGAPKCEPIAADVACAGKCGVVSNGCGAEVDGGVIDCSELFPCPAGQACGAGGTPNVCGDAAAACVPQKSSVACAATDCGAVGDGCGGSHECGSCGDGLWCSRGTCKEGCSPLTQQEACGDKECGTVSDGCSGSHDCGGCAAGEACGLKVPFQCDVVPPPVCVPRTAAQACAGRECGVAYDGCGSDPANVIDCSSLKGPCPAGTFCGIREPFQCDEPVAPACTAATSCAELGWACGIAFDDCGNMFDCEKEGRFCNAGNQSCGGGIGSPTTCEGGADSTNYNACDVCDSIPDCSAAAQKTIITGRVISPGRNAGDSVNQVGVPSAFVYIMRNNKPSEIPAIASGVPAGGTACDRCDEQQLGPVLASATSDAFGNFSISGNIPVGEEFILVVKIGKWRRAVQMTLPAAAACKTTAIASDNTRLPRSMNDALGVNIPRVAVTTGQVDAMECVLWKMGVADSEFSAGQAGGTARIHLYGNDGATINGGASNPAEEALHADAERLMSYDMLIFDCQGELFPDHDASDPRIREYVNRGGRMFASHLSYTWICDNGPTLNYTPLNPYNTGLAKSATFPGCPNEAGEGLQNPGVGLVSVGHPSANASKIQNFADWLVRENAATLTDGKYRMSIVDPRNLATAVGAASEQYLHIQEDNSVQQYAFNTPYGAPEAAICGRVAYSGFHVAAAGDNSDFKGDDFPSHCSDAAASNGDLTDQEKVLLYMLFDLGACVGDRPPSCVPFDCSGRCGVVPDGCGGALDCSCGGGQVCNEGMGVCEAPTCTKTSCAAASAECGFIPDGCGGVLDCGSSCGASELCDIKTNTCQPTCTPLTVQLACNGKCGFVSDGCGQVLECPGCAGALNCVAGVCTAEPCVASACPVELECGFVSDGCAGTAACGTCAAPESCGGGRVANLCGTPECKPFTCDDLGAACGWVGDGCGGMIECGSCDSGQVCGSDGQNQCTGCKPIDCATADADCGVIGDGCGGTVECGDGKGCALGQVCGGQKANQCGVGASCTPLDCEQAGAKCGKVGDGCGGVLDCGSCASGAVCGYSKPLECGTPPPCVPTTCDAEEANCGEISDHCAGRLFCGKCKAGSACRENRCKPIDLGDSK